LAREPAADDIDGNSSLGKSGSVKGSDVIELRYLWPVMGQHTPAERVDLAERHGLESASAFQAKAKAADA
jgi:hypothetical protein